MVPVFDESLSITHFDDIVSKSVEFVLRNLIQHILTLQNTPREKKKDFTSILPYFINLFISKRNDKCAVH